MEFDIQTTLVFLVGFLASFVGSSAGGGHNLISVPLLMAIGVPVKTVFPTIHVGGVGLNAGALVEHFKKKTLIWSLSWRLSIILIVGYALGAKLLTLIDPEIVAKFTGIFILFMLPFLFADDNLGLRKRKVPLSKRILGKIFTFIVSIIGAFGVGANIIFSYINLFFFGITTKQNNALLRFTGFFGSITAVVVFWANGYFDLSFALVFFVAMALGGFLGAKLALKIDEMWLKKLLSVVIVISSIKLIFF